MSKTERGPNDPPIVNPKEFLDRPFERIEVGELPTPPDLDLLKWVVNLENETGFVLQIPRWFVIKASSIGVPSFSMPTDSDVLIHSHPKNEQDERDDGSIPSLSDFMNASEIARNLILSEKGITQFWPIDPDLQGPFKNALIRGSFGLGNIKDYLAFLERHGAKFNTIDWAEANLQSLLNPQALRS